MKTTIDISDPLLETAKAVAAREGITLKALVESGLREVLQSRESGDPFKLRKASFSGKGSSAVPASCVGTKSGSSLMVNAARDRGRYEHSGLRT